MTNPLSVNNQVAMSGMDPYLYYALQSPNVNSPSFRGTSSTTDTTAATTTTTTASQPSFQAAPAEPEKKSNTAKWILGIAAAGAAAFILRKAYVKGDSSLKLFQRIGDGFKNWFNGAKDKVLPKISTITKVNGETVVTLPGQKNVMTNAADIAKIGETAPSAVGNGINNIVTASGAGTSATYKLNEGNELLKFVFTDGAGNKVICSNGGKTVNVLDAANKNITSELILKDKTRWDAIMKQVKEVQTGKVDFSTLSEVLVKNTNAETGLVSRIRYNGTGNGEFVNAISERFDLNNKFVKASRLGENNALNKAIEAFAKGETKDMKVVSAVVPATLKINGVDTAGEFIVDGAGKITGFQPTGKKVIAAGTADFRAINFDNIDAFKAATDKNNWQRMVYKAA